MNQRTRWVRAGLISQEQAEALASFERARVRAGFVRAIFGVAILAMGAGFLVLVASRWDRLSDAVKLGGHALLNLAAIALIWRGLRRPAPANDWARDGGLGLFLGLNLSFLLLLAHTLDLEGSPTRLLVVWMLVSSAPLLRWGQSTWLASGWTVGFLVTVGAGAVDVMDHLPEWVAFLHLYALSLFVPTLFLSLGCHPGFARLRPVWAAAWRHAGNWLFLAGASLSTGLWYVDLGSTLRRLVQPAIPLWGLWAFLVVVLIGAMALAVRALRAPGDEADRRIALLSLGVMALPALTLAGELGLLGALLFIAYWSAVGWIGVWAGSNVLMGFAVWLVAGRVLVLTLEYFGGMFATGLGLVLGGVLILGFLRVAAFLQSRLRSAALVVALLLLLPVGALA